MRRKLSVLWVAPLFILATAGNSLAACPGNFLELLNRNSAVTVECHTEKQTLHWLYVTRICMSANGEQVIAYENKDGQEQLVGMCRDSFEIRY